MKPSTTQKLLREELNYFNCLLADTQQFIKQQAVTDLDFDDLNRFLIQREEVIKSIVELENKRKQGGETGDHIYRETDNKIALIANNLVEIDAQILELIKDKKQKMVKDINKIAENKSRGSNAYHKHKGSPKLVDIKQ